MAFSFPPSPAYGDKYPVPSVPGIPTYTWDGEKWTTYAIATGSEYVRKTGDDMSGNLTVNSSVIQVNAQSGWANVVVNKPAGANSSQLVGKRVNLNRWTVELGNSAVESTGNVGSDFSIGRCDDAGNYVDSALSISRQTGVVYLSQQPNAPTAVATKGYVDTRQLNYQGGIAYTLVLTDAGKLILMTSANANTITIPPNSSVAFPLGTQVDIMQAWTGQTSIAPGAGVNLLSDTSKRKLLASYTGALLVKTNTDDWMLMGNLTA